MTHQDTDISNICLPTTPYMSISGVERYRTLFFTISLTSLLAHPLPALWFTCMLLSYVIPVLSVEQLAQRTLEGSLKTCSYVSSVDESCRMYSQGLVSLCDELLSLLHCCEIEGRESSDALVMAGLHLWQGLLCLCSPKGMWYLPPGFPVICWLHCHLYYYTEQTLTMHKLSSLSV